MHSEILKPIVALIGWSLVMLIWMIASRLPAMNKAGINISKLSGGNPGGLDGVIPEQAQWPAHNYNHLMEQPTLFYAVSLALAVAGVGNGLNATLAWAYVVLRVLHSLVQATINRILFRFILFAASSVALIALTVHAAITVF